MRPTKKAVSKDYKYMKFEDFDLSGFNVDNWNYVQLPYENSGKTKVLFVLDHMPKEDIESGKLLSGVTGDLLSSILSATKKLYSVNKSFSWLACTFNVFRHYGKSAEFRSAAEEAFKRRLNQVICKYKPDYVVTFGTSVMRALLEDKITEDGRGRKRFSYWLGVPVKKTIKSGKLAHETTILSNLSLNDIVTGDSAEAGILGYVCRCLSPVFGKTYLIDSEEILKDGVVYIDTIKRFDKLIDVLAEKEVLAIDTETRNLNKITNQLLTVQFAYSENKAFLIPVSHKDSPFKPSEIQHIHNRLRDFFEGNNRNKYHVYVNGKFDLAQFRASCGVRYFSNPVWDCLGGEFAQDENLRNLDTMIGEYYYSLGNLSVQYGYEGYLDAEFSKQHRADFYNADLTDDAVQYYCGLDCCVPLAIHRLQKQRAKDMKYTGFEQVVLNEISDTIHAFSKMENTGAGLDVDYLFYLRTENSPIEQEIEKMRTGLLQTDAAKATNKLLADKAGVPTTSMFGSALDATVMLKMNKPEHRRMFFFDVLKLAPLSKGVSGVGKIDKTFQTTYANVPEVAQYTALEKAKKLKTAFVNSFINLLGTSEDLQKDHRIRPDFGYLTVVTHRTSARNPNLQQVPAHSALGKHIKRLFIARRGCLYIKVDYRVHEVRGWGLAAFDKAVAAVFAAAKAMRDEYRLRPTPELAKRLKTEADVHIQNASYFFNVAIEKVDKALRNAVKGVIFGLIYQMSLKSLAVVIKQDDAFTKKLVGNFQKRFPRGMKWIEDIKLFARANWYVEAPVKIRRHLWGYILPQSHDQANKVYADMDRRAVNSPIQGMCSKFMMNGIRILDRLVFKQILKDPEFQLYISNSVHDSLENEAGYANVLKSISMIEWALTDGVKSLVAKRYGFELVSDLEIDFEIGSTLSNTQAWDFSVKQLDRIIMDSIIFQRNKLRYPVNVDEAYQEVFSTRALTVDAPTWMKRQIEHLGYEFSLTEKSYIRELLNEGKATCAKASSMLAKVDAESISSGKALMLEGNDQVEYARELNSYRQRNG